MHAMTYKNWQLEIDPDHILFLTLSRSDANVNTLNAEVITELDQILDAVAAETTLKGLVIQSGKSSGFIAGADITQFLALKHKEEAFAAVRSTQYVLDKLEALKIPTVAQIAGFCLGGGLELALACRYRVAEEGPKTQLGAPEVKLGLHPGWGGTIRLPRLIGVLPAMQINLTGKPLSAKAALHLGLVDAVVPERHLKQAARHYVLQTPPRKKPVFWHNLLNQVWLRPWVAKLLYKNLAQKITRSHYPAPYAIVDNWVKYGIQGNAAMEQEAKSIAALMMQDTSRNLVRAFFLQTRLKGLAQGVSFSAKHVHVMGAGVMGGDIAAWCALKGLKVTLQDRLPEYIAPAIQRAQALFRKKLRSPRLEKAALDLLIPDETGAGLKDADVVIEAISENLSLKQSLYQSIEPQLKEGAILATNTSSLDLDLLSQCLQYPARLVGIHFFNPVAQMQLVEVVRSSTTDPEVVAHAMAFVRAIDHLPLPVKSCPGFLVNRVLMPYLMEAILMLEEGRAAESIDQAALAFGMPMGPVELADTVGLDVCLAVAEILTSDLNLPIPDILRQKVTQKELGRKTGKGFYRYKKGKPLKAEAKEGFETLTDRLILPMLNEAIACLREDIISDADLIDAGLIFGTGFAPFRGGPLHYVKSEGISQLLERLKILQTQQGNRFTPDAYWTTLLASNDTYWSILKA